ncbi:MAG TPA: exosortase-associated EpsI family protein [Candidatus Thermoplasmatota archaeon]|nr:exosortase-associated EpsI family protein [Candidatus Thermoplasmatota archaeon]
MAETKPNYRPLYVVLGATVFAVVLASPVDAFQTGGVTFIDTELKSGQREKRQFVDTKHPIGDPESLRDFPTSLGRWNMSYEYDWNFLQELLSTDLLLSRDYRAPGVYVPVSLLIIQSTNVSSFHPAPVCYKAQGFTIRDELTTTVTVPVKDSSWAESGWLSEREGRVFKGAIEAKELVVERTTKDGATQRELNLYFYMKEEKRDVTDRIAWIRVSMFVPAEGDYSAHRGIMMDLMGEVVPRLFVFSERQGSATVAEYLASKIAGSA